MNNRFNSNRGQEPTLPPGYLVGGYFDQKGNMKKEYLVEFADAVAKGLGIAYPAMSSSQLRKFYQHTKSAAMKLNYSSFQSVQGDIIKLLPFTAEAKGKQKVPDIFYRFIKMNLENVRNEKDFLDGFMEHFQAVVAFFTYHYPKK